VRETQDVKSARCGSVQEGEICVQSGPWRKEKAGRVRMPVRAPRGVEGWVTLDTSRCCNAEGEFGKVFFRLRETQTPQPEATSTKVEATAAKAPGIDDLDWLLGPETEAPPRASLQTAKPTRGAKSKLASTNRPALVSTVQPVEEPEAALENEHTVAEEEEQEVLEQKAEKAEKADPGRAARESKAAATRPPVPLEVDQKPKATPKPEGAVNVLTASQRRLRALRKKLRDVEAIETKSGELTEAQRAKISTKNQLESEINEVSALVEAEAAASLKKRKKRTGTARKKSAGEGQVVGSSNSRLPLLVGLPVLVAVLLRLWFW